MAPQDSAAPPDDVDGTGTTGRGASGADPDSGATGPDSRLPETAAALAAPQLRAAQRRRLLRRLAGQTRVRDLGRLPRPRPAVRWVADPLADLRPPIPRRDLDTPRPPHAP